MSEFKKYLRTNVAEMRPYVEGETLSDRVSISAADLENGSPKVGDMIARNPNDPGDQWLVAAQYFQDNFKELGEASVKADWENKFPMSEDGGELNVAIKSLD